VESNPAPGVVVTCTLDTLIVHMYTIAMTKRPRGIADEIHQTRPFASPGHELVLGLARTAALLEGMGAEVLGETGLTGPQYNVLRILRGAGPGGLPTLTIRDRMVDLSPGVTRLVDRLVASGHVTRDRGADRRQVFCRITPAGLALLKTLDAPVNTVHERAVAGLSVADQRTLIRLLDQMRAGILTDLDR
jgi:DNA-binding MarR family transcriptional regulator